MRPEYDLLAGKQSISKNMCGRHLKRIRLERHLTLTDIQAMLKLNYGILLHRTNLGRIERGIRTVSDVELAVFARILDVSLSDLLWGEAAPSGKQEMAHALQTVEIRYAQRRPSSPRPKRVSKRRMPTSSEAP